MTPQEQTEVLGFFTLLGGYPPIELTHRYDPHTTSLSCELLPTKECGSLSGVEVFWHKPWVNLSVWLPYQDLPASQLRSLLTDPPEHLQCAIDHKQRLYLTSKFHSASVRQEVLYQRFEFLLRRLNAILGA